MVEFPFYGRGSFRTRRAARLRQGSIHPIGVVLPGTLGLIERLLAGDANIAVSIPAPGNASRGKACCQGAAAPDQEQDAQRVPPSVDIRRQIKRLGRNAGGPAGPEPGAGAGARTSRPTTAQGATQARTTRLPSAPSAAPISHARSSRSVAAGPGPKDLLSVAGVGDRGEPAEARRRATTALLSFNAKRSILPDRLNARASFGCTYIPYKEQANVSTAHHHNLY